MYLSLLFPNPDHPLARKDVADPYAMHQTLAHLVPSNDRVLWRLELDRYGENTRVLVQTLTPPRWSRILDRDPSPYGVLAPDSPKPFHPVLRTGQHLRFRLYANPTVTREGKRLGIYRENEQIAWLQKRLAERGALVKKVLVSRREKRRFRKRSDTIVLATAQFDGIIEVQKPDMLLEAIQRGIGHGKAFGLGLLSVAPVGG